jgi:hypothetical protein|tara:strand:+ start:53 stop:355 length:303 start_codon:yes stop_codon:yes gene_type:complete
MKMTNQNLLTPAETYDLCGKCPGTGWAYASGEEFRNQITIHNTHRAATITPSIEAAAELLDACPACSGVDWANTVASAVATGYRLHTQNEHARDLANRSK